MNDVVRDILTGVGVAAAVGSFTLILNMRDGIKKVMQTVYGENGDNGLKGSNKNMREEINALILWRAEEKAKESTVTEIERELLKDSGRRPGRLRDVIQHPDMENT